MSEDAWLLFDRMSDELNIYIERVSATEFHISDRAGARLHGPFLTNELAARFLLNGGGKRAEQNVPTGNPVQGRSCRSLLVRRMQDERQRVPAAA